MNYNPLYNPNRYIIYRHSYEIIYDTNNMNYLHYSPRVIYHPVQTFFRSNPYPNTPNYSDNNHYPEVSYLSNVTNINNTPNIPIPGTPTNRSYYRTDPGSNNDWSFNRPLTNARTENQTGQPLRRQEIIRPPPGFEQFIESDFFQALYPLINNFEDIPIIITEEQFENLETIDSQTIEEETNCIICQDNLRNQPVVKILPCHHMFHIDCAKQWLCRTSCKCPVCRYDIRESF